MRQFHCADSSRFSSVAAHQMISAAIAPVRNPKTPLKTLDQLGMAMHWVLINRVVEYTGYSDDAIRAKQRRGDWKEGIHWRKGPDNRLVFNLIAIQNWMGGFDA